jgi:hypothetical protein
MIFIPDAAGACSGTVSVPPVRRCSITFAMFLANSANSTRATCTPPAEANISSGPATSNPPSMVTSVVWAPRASTSNRARARDAPFWSMPRASIRQRFTG